MGNASYQMRGQDFYINEKLTYAEIPDGNPKAQGLLFNARLIQAVFNDVCPKHRHTYDRFGKTYDADQNVQELIEALPAWYQAGLRAFTVGIQAGGPIYSFKDWSEMRIKSFSEDGKSIDPDCLRRLRTIIEAADQLGMLVIVSYFYQGQFQYFRDDDARVEAAKTATKALCEMGYDNIIIEVANEYDTLNFQAKDTVLYKHEEMARLIASVREWCGDRFAVGSSNGYRTSECVIQASSVSLIHGNTKRRQELHDFVRQVRKWGPDQPIVVNEDSPLQTQVDVAIEDHFSWGYYNTMTKQEPPCDWGITKGEDEYFAYRMAEAIGIKLPALAEDSMMLQGFEPEMTIDDGRYVRVAAKHPERIERVRFYEDNRYLDTAFSEPFMLESRATWIQEPYYPADNAKSFTAKVYLLSGETRTLTQDLTILPKSDRNRAHESSPMNAL